MSTLRLRNIDLTPITLSAHSGEASDRVAHRVVDSLVETGAVVVRSPFVQDGDNTSYLKMLEGYCGRSQEELRADERPEAFRQVGITLPGGEDFHLSQHFRDQLGCRMLTGDRAPYPCDGANLHMRFFWRHGERRHSRLFPQSHADPVIPAGIPEWEATMTGWGNKMYASGELLMRHVERGLGVTPGSLVEMLRFGPHLVAPTAIDLAGLPLGTVTSDVHTDFNPLTLHGAAAYSTLVCWTKGGLPFLVRVPPGCLLVQAGVGLEWMTGGAIKAGYHQTVVLPETIRQIETLAPGRSTIRASSTFFLHFDWEATLQVLPELRYPGCDDLYTSMLVGDHALQVIRAIGLAKQR